ncbi:unnamed protein product [Calicophoron daubneyi]|uniref:Nuclear receptor domain-containing protein n=1 Tax=Calicophoron daubneyi TaxID=300641 RepID=A0AAV2TG38_CALDB
MSANDFQSLDLTQGMCPVRESVYGRGCAPMPSDALSHHRDVPIHAEQRIDPTNRLSMDCSSFGGYDRSRDYSQSSVESLSVHSYQRTSFSEVPGSATRDSILNSVVRTRRRKAGISDEERICIVCGEPASGYNFDRLTCESCKAFFRRNALKPRDKIKACSRGGGCAVEGNQRKHCPSCRLEKCFAVGMKRELILPPEKLEQRAKPKRRKHTSPDDSNYSPQPLLTAPSSVGSASATVHPPFMPSPLSMGSHPQQALNTALPLGSHASAQPPSSMNLPPYAHSHTADPTLTYSSHSPSVDSHDPISCQHSSLLCTIPPRERSGLSCTPQYSSNTAPLAPSIATNLQPTSIVPYSQSESRLARCRRTCGTTLCRHRRCWRFSHRTQLYKHQSKSKRTEEECDIEVNVSMLNCLKDCIQRIREPFTPEEQLETGIAVTLEQEYNRMDACIRRIIRVVKLLPYFTQIGKPAQLSLLRTNIYGLIVLYSSFFFESDIRKLRYPVLQPDGQLTTVTVSMLDEVVTPSTNNTGQVEDGCVDNNTERKFPSTASSSDSQFRSDYKYAAGLREEFELYKANTLAAFDHLDQLVGSDDILRVTILAIKLFSEDSLTEDMRESVCAARQAYLLFLWAYLRSRAGPKKLRSATELYARLLIAFIDLRTLEIRMTEFAKLLSLDGLSPLMREVCSQRTVVSSTHA